MDIIKLAIVDIVGLLGFALVIWGTAQYSRPIAAIVAGVVLMGSVFLYALATGVDRRAR